jgi:flagellar biosynthesis protein FlhG
MTPPTAAHTLASTREKPLAQIGPRQAQRIIAVGGGKGGIGKSLLAANVATDVALRGLNTVIVDCDLGGANVHTFLGMERPEGNLSDFILRRVESLPDVMVDTPVEHLSLVSGAFNALQSANIVHQQKRRLLRSIEQLDAECVILDLGAGTSFNVLDFFLLADHGVLVLTPEPTAVENVYRFLKAAFLRRLQKVGRQLRIEKLIQASLQHAGARSVRPIELIENVAREAPDAGEALFEELRRFQPLLIVNQVREPSDETLGDSIRRAAHTVFGIQVRCLGAIRWEDRAWRAVRESRTLRLDPALTSFSSSVRRITDRLLTFPTPIFRSS